MSRGAEREVSMSRADTTDTPPREIRLVIPFDLARLSKNRRYYPAERRRIQRDSATLAFYVWDRLGRPEMDGPVDVTPIVRRASLMDDSNVYHALEWIRDQLFSRNQCAFGITPHDGPKYFRWLPVQFDIKRIYRGYEEVELVIVPRSEETP